MALTNQFFENPFDSKNITAARLAAFGQDTLSRLSTETTTPYTTLATGLQAPVLQLQTEVGDVDTSFQREKSKVTTVKQFRTALAAAIREAEPQLASALGGYESLGYKQFFPAGTREYTQASKKTIPLLTTRLVNMCAEFSAMLPPALVTKLSGLAPQWKVLDEAVSTSRKDTDDDRGERSAARQALELELLKAMHTIAAAFPGNVEVASRFFDFSKLKADRFASLRKDPPPTT